MPVEYYKTCHPFHFNTIVNDDEPQKEQYSITLRVVHSLVATLESINTPLCLMS